MHCDTLRSASEARVLFQRNRECQGCGKLREDLENAQRKLDALVLDWETVQDKVHRWMQRTSARARAEEREAGATPESPSAVNGAAKLNGAPPGLDPVSAKLLSLRARRRAVAQDEEEG